jgi:choline dehydrogenase-like flavoprotein
MITDARDIPAGTQIHSKICVIGGGPAGVTAFLELAGRDRDILLLEGGGTRRESFLQDTYRGEPSDMEPEAGKAGAEGSHPPLESTREKKLGGTSSWGGRCAPLDPIDFETKDGIPDTGWPVSREELATYYERANSYVEAGNFEYTSASAGLGASPFLLGNGVEADIEDTKLFRYSRPTHFGKRYRKALRRPGSRVFYHANVLSLEPGPDGSSVSSVLVESWPGRRFRVVADAFIVAVGGLESARLLLVSGRRAKAPIGTGHDSVGHYYMTHLDAMVGHVRFTRSAPLPAYSYEHSRDGIYCRRVLSIRESVQREHGLLNLGGVFFMPHPKDSSHGNSLLSAYALTKEVLYRTRIGFKSRRYGLYELHQEPVRVTRHLRNITADPWSLARFVPTWTTRRWLAKRKLPSFLTQVNSGTYRIHFCAEQTASFANSVFLGESADRFGVPRLRVRWQVATADYESIGRSLQIMSDSLGKLGLAHAAMPTTVDELIEAMDGGFLAGTHAMGTTRMGRSPASSVVDSACRVHGVRNLYIASSSVFPTGGFAPPTLTIVALAVRIADTVHKSLS